MGKKIRMPNSQIFPSIEITTFRNLCAIDIHGVEVNMHSAIFSFEMLNYYYALNLPKSFNEVK